MPERTGGSFLETVLSFVREATPVATPVPARWTVVTVPAPGSESRKAISLLSKSERTPARARAASSKTTPARTVPAPDGDPLPEADTDADWYVEPEADHSTQTFAEAHPGVVRGVPRMRRTPTRDAGSPDWYDSLDTRESEAAGADSVSPSLADELLDGLDAAPHAARSSRAVSMRSSSPRAAGSRAVSTPGSEPAVACSATSTRYRLVKLEPAVASRAPLRSSAGAPAVRGLPSPAEAAGAPAIVLASLGPRLSGIGNTEYPGLAAPLPESTPTTTAFCPLGTLEKKSASERWCTRVDKGGVSFREGPVAFLHPNGKKRAVGTYVGGALQGPFVEYGTGGTKIGEGTYKNGKKAGAWTFRWDNGKKQSEGAYVAGERTGTWTYYDEKGRKTSQGELRTIGKVEKKQGRWTFWHASGTKSQEGTYREGRKDGAWKTFDEKGRQLAVLVFRDGEEESR